MSIVNPPTRGFKDWQRTGPYDTDVLYVGNGVVIPLAGEQTPILDVSRSAYLAGWDSVAAGAAEVLAVWYADAAGTIAVGNWSMVLSSAIQDPAQYRLPNLGPFVQLQWSRLAAGVSHSATIFGTDRFHPCPLIPTNPVLTDDQNTGIAASATVTRNPTDYFAGPMMVWTTVSGAGTVFLEYLTAGNVWDVIDQVAVAALTNVTASMIAPPGAWRFQVKNGAASAQSFNLTAVPSLTGAA